MSEGAPTKRGCWWPWLLGLLGVLLLIPAALLGGYMWQAGLDLQPGQNLRHYLELCRRGREDIACKAFHAEAGRYDGPLTLVFPNSTGDRELTARLTAYLVQHGYQPADLYQNAELRRRFFEAHAFTEADLSPVTLRTLDGQPHEITCPKDARGVCEMRLDGEFIYNYFAAWPERQQQGSLYMFGGPLNGRLGFVAFLD